MSYEQLSDDLVPYAPPITVAKTSPLSLSLSSPVSAFRTEAVLEGEPRTVALIASGDAVWASDVTTSKDGEFVTPTTLAPVFVPQPGVRLRSLTLVKPTLADGGSGTSVSGFITTATNVLQFDSDDLVRWQLTTVPAPRNSGLPVEVWTERERGRVGTRDGTIWSLPIMVALSAPLASRDGGTLTVDDFGRKCGAQFAATREGLFTLAAGPGLPRWVPVPSVNGALDSFQSLRLYEAGNSLYVATQSGQVIEVLATGPCP